MIRYASGNFINESTLVSVSSEDTLYVKEFMYNKRQSKPWRMTAKSGNAVFDLGANRPTIIGILNHNLLNTATITLEADNDPPNWGAPAWSQALTWHLQNIWYSFSQDYPFWRLVVSDLGNSYNLEFGEIILSTYGLFTRNYNWGYTDAKRYIKSDQVTQYGQRWRATLAKGKGFNLEFENVKDADLASEIEVFFDSFEGTDPFIFIPDDTETDCWYVECLNDFEARRRFLDVNNFGLILEEQTRGIILL